MTSDLVTKQPLMLVIYEDEKWEVVVSKDRYSLSGKQVNLLKQATIAGQRGLMWFDGFAISIPHIQSIKRTKDHTDGELIKKIEAKKKELGMK